MFAKQLMQSHKIIYVCFSSRIRDFLFSVFILYYLPPLSLWSGIIPFAWRFKLLAIMAAIMVAYDYRHGFSLKELGFRQDTLKGSLILNIIVSILFVIFMLLSFEKGLIRTPTIPGWKLFFAYYFFVSCPLQEFLFRSNLFALMKRAGIKGALLQITVSAVTYSFLHIFYNDLITLATTLTIGLMWGGIYYKYPNFWGVAISHAVLGVVAIKVGLI